MHGMVIQLPVGCSGRAGLRALDCRLTIRVLEMKFWSRGEMEWRRTGSFWSLINLSLNGHSVVIWWFRQGRHFTGVIPLIEAERWPTDGRKMAERF